MRLSEAIRLGAMLRPQARHDYMRTGRSCAIGAALEAIGIPLRNRADDDFERTNEHEAIQELRLRPEFHEWGKLEKPANRICPGCGRTPDSVSGVIIELNNQHGWTRERIADWVEGVEHEPVPLEPVAEEAPCNSAR